jgi:hypothetical protein
MRCVEPKVFVSYPIIRGVGVCEFCLSWKIEDKSRKIFVSENVIHCHCHNGIITFTIRILETLSMCK